MQVDFTGKIVNGKRTVFEEVSGYYILHPSGSLLKWSGELTIESGEQPHLFKGRLITDDGQQGECFGERFNIDSSAIVVHGSGPIG